MATGRVITYPSKGVVQAFWEGLAAGESGDSVDISRWHEKTVQVTGDFNTETLTIEGSNDGVNWVTLTYDGDMGTPNSVSFTSAGLMYVYENPRYIRPSLSGSSGGDVDITLIGVSAP